MKNLSCKLFSGITEQQLNHLKNCLQARQVKFSIDEEICTYSNTNNEVGVILTGRAHVKKLDRNGDYTILETLNKNSIFSNVFTYTATDANYISVFACEPTIVLFFDFSAVFKRCPMACQYHSIFVHNLMEAVLEKSKVLSQRVEILSNKTIRDKILSYLSLMVDLHGSAMFTLPMSYTSLAQYLCVDRSAMMREFKRLATSGILKVNKKDITVISKEYI